jgi:hypothetical protein
MSGDAVSHVFKRTRKRLRYFMKGGDSHNYPEANEAADGRDERSKYICFVLFYLPCVQSMDSPWYA